MKQGLVVYIGAAIDQAIAPPEEQYGLLKKLVVEALGDGNFVGYSPFNAFFGAESTRSQRTNAFITEVNTEALWNADLAVFIWSDSPSFGVPIEIATCVEHKIPFVVWDRSSKKVPSIYLMDAIEKGVNSSIARNEPEVRVAVKKIADKHQGPAIENKSEGTTEAPDAGQQ